jgi:hypothetical protein
MLSVFFFFGGVFLGGAFFAAGDLRFSLGRLDSFFLGRLDEELSPSADLRFCWDLGCLCSVWDGVFSTLASLNLPAAFRSNFLLRRNTALFVWPGDVFALAASFEVTDGLDGAFFVSAAGFGDSAASLLPVA